MNTRQIQLVQASFEQVLPIADTVAALFYGRLFEIDPGLRPLFKGDVQEQGRNLMLMLTVVVRGLNRIEQLSSIVQALGRRHGGYGVHDEDYTTVAEALLWTLEKGLGEAFTDEVEEAWLAAYILLATTMQAATRATEVSTAMLA